MFFSSFGLQVIGHHGVWWDILVRYISWRDGRKTGESFPSEALTFHWLNLPGLMGGLWGGRLGGWEVGGQVGEIMHHDP